MVISKRSISIAPHTNVLFKNIDFLAGDLEKKKRLAIILDTNMERLYGKSLIQKLEKHPDVTLIAIQPGESAKTRETKQYIEDVLLEKKYGRDSCILAVGGGVVLDLAGFVAATYCRGISFISIPTTLLAMVDASIGGKTGINLPQGKNLIGAFHPPERVYIDLQFLKTLPKEEWKNGFAEIIKYGLISSRSLFKEMEEWKEDHLNKIIYKSIQIKKKVIEKDPEEKGLRRILNFGHTVGHALEALFEYQISHGQAIATGMILESYLCLKRGLLTKKELDQICKVIRKHGFSHDLLKETSFPDLMEAMRIDKKSLQTHPRFVMLRSIGKISSFQKEYCTIVDSKSIEEAYEFFSN